MGSPGVSAVAKHAVHFASETAEHYTPGAILTAVERCLGEIFLDPCADPGKRVRATLHFTKKDDGLSREWHGTVFMNPPYGRGILAWAEKLCHEWEAGRVSRAIALMPARPDTKWFRCFRDCPVCFVAGRLKFLGNKEPAPFPSVLFYLGADEGGFKHHFEPFGDIYRRLP